MTCLVRAAVQDREVRRFPCARRKQGSQIWNSESGGQDCLIFQTETYEHCAELVFTYIVNCHRRSNLDGDDKVQTAVHDLLVATNRFDCFGNRQIRDRREWA